VERFTLLSVTILSCSCLWSQLLTVVLQYLTTTATLETLISLLTNPKKAEHVAQVVE
jgi:hypothetical protein